MPDGPGPAASEAGARVGALFSEHGRMVYGLCRLLLRDPTEAEDAAQETFLAAYRALLRGGGPRDPAAWLAAIARNECRTRLRVRGRELLPGSQPDAGATEAADTVVERRLWADELAGALGELPHRQREAVVLRDLYGLRTREVGAALGLSRPAVESLVFRARRRLRVRLRPAAGALVLPLALREGLAQALPGFASGSAAAAGATGAAVSGTALLAKLAAGTAAVGTATSVALVESDRPAAVPSRPAPAPVAPPPARARPAPAPAPAPVPAPAVVVEAERDEPRRGRSGSGRDEEDGRDRSGHGRGGGDDSEHGGPSGPDEPERSNEGSGESGGGGGGSGPSEADEPGSDSSGPGGGGGGGGSGPSKGGEAEAGSDSSGPGGGSGRSEANEADPDSSGPGGGDSG